MPLSAKRLALPALFFSVLVHASAAEPVPQEAAIGPGFEAFYNNEYDEALQYFEAQVKLHPDEPEQYNHIAQTILYRELYRNGSLESQLVSGNNAFLRRAKLEISPQDRQAFNNSISKALSLAEEKLKRNGKDVKALYSIGVSHGLRSTFSFLVEKAWTDALHEASVARRAQEKVIEIDPGFIDARLSLGVYQYVVASLPFYLRAAGFLNGFHGDRAGGLAQLEQVAREGVSNRNDAKVLLAILYRRERLPQKAIPLLEQLALRFPGNVLFLFEQVQMYSDSGDKANAVRVLNQIENLHRAKAPGYAAVPQEKIDYVAGNFYFWYRDYDIALERLKRASLHTDALDLNSAVLTWLRIGQIYDLRNDRQNARQAYSEAIRTAPNSEVANEAKRYISAPYRRASD